VSEPAPAHPQIAIRPVAPDDFPQAGELFGALHAYNATFDPAFQLSDDWPSHLTESFEHAQHQPDTLWALAWDGDEAVGLLIAERHLEAQIFRRRHWIELSALYVRPSHRRHGVARLLVDHLLAWSQARGFESVQLYVSAGNVDAQAFYARQGFEPIQEIWRKQLPSSAAGD